MCTRSECSLLPFCSYSALIHPQERLSYKKLLEALKERGETNARYGDLTFRSAVMGRPIGQLDIGALRA